MKRILVLIMALSLLFAGGCRTTETLMSDSFTTSDENKIVKEQINIPAISYYWAKEDNGEIYYFADKKLWKYDTESEANIVITDNLINPYDFAVYDGTIYTLESIDDESNPYGLFVYDEEADSFAELMRFDNMVHSLVISGHYLVATTDADDSDGYEVYDLVVDDKPKQVELNEVEVIKEEPEIKTDEYNEELIYSDETILTSSQLEADVIEVWGWDDSYAYISAILQGEDEFSQIDLNDPENYASLGKDIKRIAVFDDVLLFKYDDESVDVIFTLR